MFLKKETKLYNSFLKNKLWFCNPNFPYIPTQIVLTPCQQIVLLSPTIWPANGPQCVSISKVQHTMAKDTKRWSVFPTFSKDQAWQKTCGGSAPYPRGCTYICIRVQPTLICMAEKLKKMSSPYMTSLQRWK